MIISLKNSLFMKMGNLDVPKFPIFVFQGYRKAIYFCFYNIRNIRVFFLHF